MTIHVVSLLDRFAKAFAGLALAAAMLVLASQPAAAVPPLTVTVGSYSLTVGGATTMLTVIGGCSGLDVTAGSTFVVNTPGVVTLSGATVTPAAPGTTTITASYTDDCGTNSGTTNLITVQQSTPATSYLYTGKGFTLFQCLTSPSLDCATPGAGNPYSASNAVTATLTLISGPLGPNLTAFSDFSFQLTMSDGQQTLSSSQDITQQACVSTDGSGKISAWYLDLGDSVNGPQIFTQNGLSNTDGCFAGGGAEDYGRSFFGEGLPYGYNLGRPGPFSPPYRTGSVNANSCIAPQHCDLLGGVLPFTITDTLGLIPTLSDPTITQQLCVVPADPRGRSCGATDDEQPRRLKASDVCPGFGATIVPAYLCGSSGLAPNGTQGTGFALIRGVAEGVDSLNGVIVDFSSNIDAVLPSPGNLRCPQKVGAVGTRTDSLVEEQTPEDSLLLEMTTGCDEARQGHPGASIESAGLKLRLDDTRFDNDEQDVPPLVSFTRYKFRNLLTVVADTHFANSTEQAQLTTCIQHSRGYLNDGSFNCAAEKVYQCDVHVHSIGAADFGPATSPLRLPDPFGDIDSRLGNLFYTINSRIQGHPANPDWPLASDPGLCPHVSPYP